MAGLGMTLITYSLVFMLVMCDLVAYKGRLLGEFLKPIRKVGSDVSIVMPAVLVMCAMAYLLN